MHIIFYVYYLVILLISFFFWESYGNVQKLSKGVLNLIYFLKKGEVADKENRKVKENEEGH